jgi:hypothetical protein
VRTRSSNNAAPFPFRETVWSNVLYAALREHAPPLTLAVSRRLVWQHENVVAGRLRGSMSWSMSRPPPSTSSSPCQTFILTPHMAGPSWENWKKAFRNSFDNIERVARGEKPLWVIPELRG